LCVLESRPYFSYCQQPFEDTTGRDDEDLSDSTGDFENSGKRKTASIDDGSTSTSRKRNKFSPEDLERRVKELENENNELKAHLQNLEQRNLDKQKQRSMMETLMNQIVNTSGSRDSDSHSKLEELLEKYTESYADYGKSRVKEINFHLNQLEKLAIPTTTTKMILFTIQQDKSFASSPLFDEISANLKLSPDQIEKIQERRQIIRDLIKKLRRAFDLTRKLKVAIANKHKNLDSRLTAIRNIATAKQTVQLLFWIVKNSHRLQPVIPNFTT
jgi:DNA repair exonuclease SbcCD ATPase subunit